MKKMTITRLLPAFLLCITLISCKSGPVVIEDTSAGAGAAEEVVVPEDKTAPAETITSEDITTETASVREGEGAKAASPASASIMEGLKAVHFDFDKYTIREEDKEVLRKNAEWLKSRAEAKVIIEGHADERGETEYNLALGEKRAESVKSYLETLGVRVETLSTISYGEEKPADPGHDEAAWSKNRRAEFKSAK